jgi:hypothetical protein
MRLLVDQEVATDAGSAMADGRNEPGGTFM